MNNQPWTGNDLTKADALPIRHNAPFWYMHHPNTCWEFIQYKGNWMFLPKFRRLFEIAGVNGVRMVPNGGTDSQMARVKMMDNGFEVLDWEMGYQTRHRTKSGGWFYSSIWDTPKVIGNQVVWKRDLKNYNDWRYELLNTGVLEMPDVDVLEFFVDMQEKRVQRNEGKNMTPRLLSQYEKDVKKLELMKAYIKHQGPVTDDGKPPKKTKGKRDV